MEPIETVGTGDTLQKGYFTRIGDLINIEGPILSLFEDERNQRLYLYDWVDSDQNTNRWLIYQILPSDLFEFIDKKISHLELFKRADGGKYYYADIDNSKQIGDYKISRLNHVLEVYFPTEDQFFDETFCTDTGKIFLFVSRAKAIKQSGNSYSISRAIRIPELTGRELIMELRSEASTDPSGAIVLNIDARLENSNWLNAAEVGPNTIYDENIKTEEAHVRQSYKLPRRETEEVSAQ